MKKNFKFIAELSGDGECFCFKISKEQYIKTFGIEKYNEKLNLIQESNEFSQNYDITQDYTNYNNPYLQDENPAFLYIYPGEFFENVSQKIKIDLSFEIEKS